MKYKIFTALALAGSAWRSYLGMGSALQTLVIFMAADWITEGYFFRRYSEKAEIP